MEIMKKLFLVLLVATVPLAFSASDDKVVQEMVDGASHFLGGLQEYQRGVAAFEFDDEERFNWHFIPRERKGLPLQGDESRSTKTRPPSPGHGLELPGAQKALDIMYLDHILFELQRRAIRDTDRYYVTVFGEPSTSGDWGWRVEGHHLSLNFSIRNGRLASASPLFMGSNPAIVQDGPHKGMQTLAEEELMGRELLHTLADRSKVLIQAEAPEDIITRASRRAEIGIPQGVTLSSLEAGQKDLLMRLITIYAISASARDRRGRDGTHQQEGNGFHSLRLGR